jgi:hypothetical protein
MKKKETDRRLIKAFELITQAQKLLVEASSLAAPSGIGFDNEIRIKRKFGVDRKKDSSLMALLENLKACDEKEKQREARSS